MSRTMVDLWNGNLAPWKHCGSNNPEMSNLADLMARNRAALLDGLTVQQTEIFQKYVDCAEEYLLRMMEQAFCEGFSAGSRLAAEALIGN